MPQTATYVYCIVHRVGRPSMARVPAGLPGSSKPSLVDLGRSMWCVTADVPLARYAPSQLEAGLRNLAWVSEMAVAHEAVVEHFTKVRGATVVPMKLLTMFSTPERAEAEMRMRRPELAAIVRRVRGCAEWGVRVMRRQAEATSRPSRPVASGAAFLAAKRQARDDARQAARRAADVADRIYERLAPFAKAARRRNDTPAGVAAPPLLDAVFLVSGARKIKFRAVARQAAVDCRSAGAELTITGPWPAYNFARRSGDPA
jgi:Gas vesicle synthesis protein GvpL/GvpF